MDTQAILIHVISGFFYVILVLREGSKIFGHYHTELLNSEYNEIVFIPERFAYGFISLTDNTIFSYHCSGS